MKVNKDILNDIEKKAGEIEKLIFDIVNKYTEDMDAYTEKIKHLYDSDFETISNKELSIILMRLCSFSYFMGSKQEILALRKDISKALYDEKYNISFLKQSGTVAAKQSLAEGEAREEAVLHIIFDRSYRILKNKYDCVNTMIDAIKKIQTIKIKEMELGVH